MLTGCYFLLLNLSSVSCFFIQAIPGAIAEVRGNDGKSPLEASEFILHILKVFTEFMYETVVS